MGADQNIDFRLMAASALEWWRDAGVDMLVDDAPRDWLAPPAISTPATTDGSIAARPARAPAKPLPAVAPLPTTLEAFEQWRLGPDAPDAGWSETRIGGAGSAASGLMVLVEAPEREDEATGQLLSGAVGTLFDRMLAAIGRDRSSIYLASVAVARPIAGRIPSEAIEELGRIARHHVALVAPIRLLIFGNTASRVICGADVAALRGSLHDVNHGTGKTGVVASFHPRFLLERPAAKAEAWRDLQLLVRGIVA
jgi:DNA polymerase